MEEIYQGITSEETPDRARLILLFGVFAGSALSSTPKLLQELNSTQAQGTSAYKTYMRLGLSLLQGIEPIPASTTALAAMANLSHFINNDDGYSMEGHLIRARCYWIARAMEIHKIDTPRRRKERKANRFDVVEVEVQRRVWWSLVASDWYAFLLIYFYDY